MLSRRHVVCVGFAAALALTVVTPAAAAPLDVSSGPGGVFAPCPPPTADSNGRPLPTHDVVISSASLAITGGSTALPACRMLVARPVDLPFPKGAPETGGGGMAAQVGSWK